LLLRSIGRHEGLDDIDQTLNLHPPGLGLALSDGAVSL
jgi:hypothetical protein